MPKKQIIIGLITISFLGASSFYSYTTGYKAGYNDAVIKTTNDITEQVNNDFLPALKAEALDACKAALVNYASSLSCPVSQQTFQQFQIEYKTNQLLDKLLYP